MLFLNTLNSSGRPDCLQQQEQKGPAALAAGPPNSLTRHQRSNCSLSPQCQGQGSGGGGESTDDKAQGAPAPSHSPTKWVPPNLCVFYEERHGPQELPTDPLLPPWKTRVIPGSSYCTASGNPCSPIRWRALRGERETESSFFYNKLYIVFTWRPADVPTSGPRSRSLRPRRLRISGVRVTAGIEVRKLRLLTDLPKVPQWKSLHLNCISWWVSAKLERQGWELGEQFHFAQEQQEPGLPASWGHHLKWTQCRALCPGQGRGDGDGALRAHTEDEVISGPSVGRTRSGHSGPPGAPPAALAPAHLSRAPGPYRILALHSPERTAHDTASANVAQQQQQRGARRRPDPRPSSGCPSQRGPETSACPVE
ncbi:PREDICTED: uncharacterized protein LOC105584481 [Cercocebus atys]|uniref:uncharacterized protein LOC105584481 n=1 Tax=Cercocebus atys TaxID=9531 RepID=UPI0005F3913F|nr:PREDICTED: uncharacterized protein LOC105584481 [Cercocebus atys]